MSQAYTAFIDREGEASQALIFLSDSVGFTILSGLFDRRYCLPGDTVEIKPLEPQQAQNLGLYIEQLRDDDKQVEKLNFDPAEAADPALASAPSMAWLN